MENSYVEFIGRIRHENPKAFDDGLLLDNLRNVDREAFPKIENYLESRRLDVSESVELRDYFFFRSTLTPKEKLLLDAVVMEQSVLRRSYYGLDVNIMLSHFGAADARYQLKLILEDPYFVAASLGQIQVIQLWISTIYIEWAREASEKGINWNDEELTSGLRNLALVSAAKVLGNS